MGVSVACCYKNSEEGAELDRPGSEPHQEEIVSTCSCRDLARDLAAAKDVAQAAFPFRGYIGKTEHRAVTLTQMHRVLQFCDSNCNSWYDSSPHHISSTAGCVLNMDILNLYHINTWLIMPATALTDCSMVELLADGEQIPQWFISHWWGETHAHFVACVRRHQWVRHLRQGSPYWICAYANRQHSLSSDVAADPKESSFYKALQLAHGVLLILDSHNARAETGPATPFKRIWCAFEAFVALGGDANVGQMILDVVTQVEEYQDCAIPCLAKRALGQAVVLAGTPTEQDHLASALYPRWRAAYHQTKRESSFPIGVVAHALHIELQNAQASLDNDRVHILNTMVGRNVDARPPLSSHPMYDYVNSVLRARFALSLWRQALERSEVDRLMLPQVVGADLSRTTLALDFESCDAFDDLALSQVARGIMPLTQLRLLNLNFQACNNLKCVTDLGHAVAQLPDLRAFDCNLMACSQLSKLDHLFKSLASRISLRKLRLNLQDCSRLTSIAEMGLDFSSFRRLTSLDINLHRCIALKNIIELSGGMGFLHNLRVLKLDLPGCTASLDVMQLGISLSSVKFLSHLRLSFRLCDQLASIDEIGASLCSLTALSSLSMDLRECRFLTSFKNLGAGIGSLTGLASLKLLLNGCHNAIDTAVLIQRVASLTRLERVYIRFPNWYVIQHVHELHDEQLCKRCSCRPSIDVDCPVAVDTIGLQVCHPTFKAQFLDSTPKGDSNRHEFPAHTWRMLDRYGKYLDIKQPSTFDKASITGLYQQVVKVDANSLRQQMHIDSFPMDLDLPVNGFAWECLPTNSIGNDDVTPAQQAVLHIRESRKPLTEKARKLRLRQLAARLGAQTSGWDNYEALFCIGSGASRTDL